MNNSSDNSESRNPMFDFQEREEFLSEEDLDIGNLPWPERIEAWNLWLSNMQSTNERDKDDYSHGVFLSEKQKRELWGDDWKTVINDKRDAA